MKSPFTNVLTWVLQGKEMAKKKKKERNISGYLFLCPCDTDRNRRNLCLLGAARVHQVMSPIGIGFWAGVPPGRRASLGLDLQEYPKQVGTFRILGPGTCRAQMVTLREAAAAGPEQAEQGVLDLQGTLGDIGDVPGAWGAWKLLQRLKLGWPLLDFTPRKGQRAWALASGLRGTLCAKKGVKVSPKKVPLWSLLPSACGLWPVPMSFPGQGPGAALQGKGWCQHLPPPHPRDRLHRSCPGQAMVPELSPPP